LTKPELANQLQTNN